MLAEALEMWPGWDRLEAGELSDARREFWQEIDAAGDDRRRAAAAALGLGGIWLHEHRSSLERARVDDLQRRAAEHLDIDDPLLHRLQMRLAAEHAYATGDLDGARTALERVRARGTQADVAEALSLLHHCMLGPEHADERRAVAAELVAIAPTTGRPLDRVMGLLWRTVDLLLDGDRRAARAITELRCELERSPCAAVTFAVLGFEVMLAMRAGRLAEAEELAHRCAALGTDVGDADAEGWLGGQLIVLRWMQGRLDELGGLLGDLLSSPSIGERCLGFEASLAAVAASSGDRTVATAALASLRAGGLASIPSSSSWLGTLHGVCEAAHALGDTDTAAEAYELLAPFADRPVMGSLGVHCLGTAHRPLALAALTMGRVDLAVGHLDAAITGDLALGNLPCVAIDRATLAMTLRERNAPGDAERAAHLLDEAVAAAVHFSMTERTLSWRDPNPVDAPQLQIERHGPGWRVADALGVAIVHDAVGMRYLARLAANRGTPIAATDLVAGESTTGAGISHPMLDDAAKAAYRRHLRELRDELDDAEACADLARVGIARARLERFTAELAAATGLGGRARPFTDNPERARVAVRKAIARAFDVVAVADAGIGARLRSSVTTGSECVMHPLPGVR